MGRTAGRRLHIVLAEETRPHASLISDYDCGVFNSGCTAISQPRGRRIIVFSEWLSANTVHRWGFGLLSFRRNWEEKVFCYWDLAQGLIKSVEQRHCNFKLWCKQAYSTQSFNSNIFICKLLLSFLHFILPRSLFPNRSTQLSPLQLHDLVLNLCCYDS